MSNNNQKQNNVNNGVNNQNNNNQSQQQVQQEITIRICYEQEKIIQMLNLLQDISVKGDDVDKLYLVKETIKNGQQVQLNLNQEEK